MCAAHTCVVTSMSETDILLGTDFMKPNNITVHLGKGMVSSDHGACQFISRPRPIPHSTKVRCSETITLQPNSVGFIKGSLQSRDSAINTTHSGYIEPYANMMINTNTLVASAMVYSENGSVPVRCINLSDQPVVLHKHKLVGFMKPIPGTKAYEDFTVTKIQTVAHSNEHFEESVTAQQQKIPSHWTKEELYKALKIETLEITDEEKQRMRNIVWNYRHCFSQHPHDLGTCNFYEAEISLKPEARPRWVPARPVPYKLRDELDNHIEGLLEADVIEPCSHKSLWNSAVMLVPKPHQPGSYRFVADFRAVNVECLPDNYQLPNINHLTDRIGGCKYYSSADLSKSFYQVSYNERSRPITAFTCNGRRYWFKKLVMGHCTSSAQFTRMMDKLLMNMPIDQICYFLDDLLIASNDVSTHLDHLEMLLQRFSAANLKLTPSKCSFLKKEVTFVGISISEAGVRITDDRVKSLKELQPPRNVKETQKLMGFLGYNRKFVKNYAAIAKPIYALIKKRTKFQWTPECQASLDELKARISSGVTLAIPDVQDPLHSFELTVDASLDGYGATLSQIQNGERKIVAFYSKAVPPHKREWGQTRLEFQAMFNAIEYFSVFLLATSFVVITDCSSLLQLEKSLLRPMQPW